MAFPDSTLSDPWPADLSAVFHADMLANTTAELNLLVPRVSDSGWTSASLGASWVAFTGGNPVAPQYRLKGGVVYLQGSMKSGVQTTTIFTLPVGYRPLHDSLFSCFSNNGSAGGTAEISIDASGNVHVGFYGGSGSSTQVTLNGISFIAEQ